MKIEDIHLETKNGVTTFRMGELVMVVKLTQLRSSNPDVPPITDFTTGLLAEASYQEAINAVPSFAATWDILDVLAPPEVRAEFLKRKQ
jgi:hypothetical protein